MTLKLDPQSSLLIERFAAHLPDRAEAQAAYKAADVNNDDILQLGEAEAALLGLLPASSGAIKREAKKIRGMDARALRAGTNPAALTDTEQQVMRSILPGANLIDPNNKKAFNNWINAAHDNNPNIKAITTDLAAWLKSTKVERVQEVLDKALELGQKQVEKMPDAPTHPVARAHLVAALAMIGTAPIAIFTRGGAHQRMPKYIVDGRSNDAGHDKSRHLFAQAMFAFVVLYDQKYGDKSVAEAFIKTVEHLDKQGAAAVVRREYERRKGALGSFLKDRKPSPKETGTIPYQSRPTGMNKAAGKAYDYAVRMGDFYEWASSGKPSFDKIGAPTGTIDSKSSTEGMSDPGTVRDMTANRVGARIAVELFGTPGRAPKIPWDDGKAAKPYRS